MIKGWGTVDKNQAHKPLARKLLARKAPINKAQHQAKLAVKRIYRQKRYEAFIELERVGFDIDTAEYQKTLLKLHEEMEQALKIAGEAL